MSIDRQQLLGLIEYLDLGVQPLVSPAVHSLNRLERASSLLLNAEKGLRSYFKYLQKHSGTNKPRQVYLLRPAALCEMTGPSSGLIWILSQRQLIRCVGLGEANTDVDWEQEAFRDSQQF